MGKSKVSLFYAAQTGDTDTIKSILDEDSDAVDSTYNGWAPLHFAAENNQKDAVELLVDERDADSEIQGPGKITPLMCAAMFGHTEVVEVLLLTAAADDEDKEGALALHYACCGGYEEAAKLLIEDEETTVSKADSEGATPLHWAAGNGWGEDLISLLITEGADVNSKDNNNLTPVDWAGEQGHDETANLLRDRGGVSGDELDQISE
ncbi:ankyrin repeat domain-containing protein [Thermoproteota archaeon]